jgi:hypothetical protein
MSELPLVERRMILSKFMPPTQGLSLSGGVRARHAANAPGVLVCSKPSQPIPRRVPRRMDASDAAKL